MKQNGISVVLSFDTISALAHDIEIIDSQKTKVFCSNALTICLGKNNISKNAICGGMMM